jgi:hypothetical protein
MTVRLKTLVSIVVIVLAVYVVVQVLPPWYANYQFQSDIEQIAIVESYTMRTEGQVQEIVAARARTYGIPLSAERIRVRRANGQLAISAEYSVHIDLPFYPFEMTFHPETKNQRL